MPSPSRVFELQQRVRLVRSHVEALRRTESELRSAPLADARRIDRLMRANAEEINAAYMRIAMYESELATDGVKQDDAS